MPRPHVADWIGALLKAAHNKSAAALAYVAVTIITGPAFAQAPDCNSPAAYVTPGQHLVGFDGRTFIPILASISPADLPPAMASAVLVVAYLEDDPAAPAMLRFFDAKGCSAGVVSRIPIEALHWIDMHIGVPA